MATSVNSGTTYAGKYFKLDTDLDLNGSNYEWTVIGDASRSFSGNFDGDNNSISNIKFYTRHVAYSGLFGYCSNATIKNLNIILDVLEYYDNIDGNDFGILTVICENCDIRNINIQCNDLWLNSGWKFGMIAVKATNTNINKCRIEISDGGQNYNVKYTGLFVCDMLGVGSITECFVSGTQLMFDGSASVFVFNAESTIIISNNLVQCDNITFSRTKLSGLFLGGDGSGCVLQNNIVNVGGAYFVYVADNDLFGTNGESYSHNAVNGDVNIIMDGDLLENKSYLYTDEELKQHSTYADWTDFDTYWVLSPSYNDGYPMLQAYKDLFAAPLFNGSGTESSPYLIQTQQDLLNINVYYADNPNSTNIYFKLANDINMSKDSSGLPIHFTPICYNKSFDGYFDGNNKTISGLLIDNQYEYTGLFGTIASNHWVKNLTVKGNIYWDEAYAVGGVAGRVLAGGYLQNCHFEGNIIGVLNTKPSTENNGVVGKFEINGAIDCTATYTDLKYAKIGGTAESPTYTYYLYDWAQMPTYLYNKKVG